MSDKTTATGGEMMTHASLFDLPETPAVIPPRILDQMRAARVPPTAEVPAATKVYGPIATLSADQLNEINRAYQRDINGKLKRKFLKFLPDAKAAMSRSKDRSTQVGAVVIDDDFNVRISGYNGFPRGVNDDIDARHERPLKYDWSAHSEENCVAQAARIGVSLKGCTILLTALFPCTGCSRMIIQSGIKRIIAPEKKHPGDGGEGRIDWSEKEKIALEMLAEAGVEIWFYSEEEA